jgi:hypothetical protein
VTGSTADIIIHLLNTSYSKKKRKEKKKKKEKRKRRTEINK